MSDKPSYLGLLNAIAVAEAEAEVYLHRWADLTDRDDVRQVLRTVALREGEHAKAFEKRIGELGFELKTRVADPGRAELAASTELTDREKFEHLGLGDDPGDGPDIFAGMFDDTTIDIQTGALLGRYIAEERDSGRRLRACYRALCAEEAGSDAQANGAASVDAGELAAMGQRLDRLEAAVAGLAEPKPTTGAKAGKRATTATSKTKRPRAGTKKKRA